MRSGIPILARTTSGRQHTYAVPDDCRGIRGGPAGHARRVTRAGSRAPGHARRVTRAGSRAPGHARRVTRAGSRAPGHASRRAADKRCLSRSRHVAQRRRSGRVGDAGHRGMATRMAALGRRDSTPARAARGRGPGAHLPNRAGKAPSLRHPAGPTRDRARLAIHGGGSRRTVGPDRRATTHQCGSLGTGRPTTRGARAGTAPVNGGR